MSAQLWTVVCMERRLGVWVDHRRAQEIAKRWRDLGLHHVRVFSKVAEVAR